MSCLMEGRPSTRGGHIHQRRARTKFILQARPVTGLSRVKESVLHAKRRLRISRRSDHRASPAGPRGSW
jgi:hypothetical protein